MGLVPAPPSPEPQIKAALSIGPPFRGLCLSTFYFTIILDSQGAAKKTDREALAPSSRLPQLTGPHTVLT